MTIILLGAMTAPPTIHREFGLLSSSVFLLWSRTGASDAPIRNALVGDKYRADMLSLHLFRVGSEVLEGEHGGHGLNQD
jgi:hypothetical protein